MRTSERADQTAAPGRWTRLRATLRRRRARSKAQALSDDAYARIAEGLPDAPCQVGQRLR